jgi:MFS transporter, DHA3 family, macrolide efflux protein
LLAAIIIGKLPEQTKKRKSLFIGIMGMGVASILMGLPVLGVNINFDIQLSFLLYMALLFVMAIFIAMLDMPMMVVMQRAIPSDMLGRVMGVLGTISAGLAPLGIILAGVFMDMIPAYTVFFITGIYFLIAAIVLYKNKAMQEY